MSTTGLLNRVARGSGAAVVHALAGLLVSSLSVAAPAAASESPEASAGPPTLRWGEPVRVADGQAQVGPWRMNESDWRYVDDPTVSIDDQGRVAVAWVDQSRKDVFFRLYDSGGRALRGAPVNVSRTPGIFSWLPRMVAAPGGRVYLLWQEIVFSGGSHGGEAFFARSTDGGRNFSEPVNLSNSRAGDGKGRLSSEYWHNGSLDLAQGADGAIYTAWTEHEGRLWLSRSTDEGQSFDEPVLVAGGRGQKPARGPSLATGSGRRVYLSWTVGEDPAADIRVAVSTDRGGSFSEGKVVTECAGHADAPSLAVDGRGTVHLVYGESPAGPLRQYRVRYTRSTDHGSTFGEARTISGLIPEPYESASYPGLRVDVNDNLYVLWHLSPGGGQRPRPLRFSVSGDGGRTFAPPATVPGVAVRGRGISGSLQGLLVSKLAAGNGRAAVVNSTFVPNEGSSIRLIIGELEAADGDSH